LDGTWVEWTDGLWSQSYEFNFCSALSYNYVQSGGRAGVAKFLEAEGELAGAFRGSLVDRFYATNASN
jgi:hypothetical protein